MLIVSFVFALFFLCYFDGTNDGLAYLFIKFSNLHSPAERRPLGWHGYDQGNFKQISCYLAAYFVDK